ncbi:metallopeptidase family protein [Qipengyuania sp. 1NDW9]|uniref:metallopeptidase family protein n=1 Tax=Qipengyuania TaxID=1855416 RepID=UPI001C87F7D9|nr:MULTISPECIES: metallopeptidase family protein [Qipengyuania]MBX7492819.1 metallopeptidase family protein [Qipengyuania xiapuensis]UOR15133.1 metallopeptidase family protein [Qipengyuania aquimaris]
MMHDRTGPTQAQMQQMAESVVAKLPQEFRAQMGEIVMRVEDFATAEQLESVELSDKWELTGLYEGVALTERSVWESHRMPARIWLFRQPLIAEWRETGVRMDDLVRHVVIHEAGHHFGFSDDDMHWLEDQAD